MKCCLYSILLAQLIAFAWFNFSPTHTSFFTSSLYVKWLHVWRQSVNFPEDILLVNPPGGRHVRAMSGYSQEKRVGTRVGKCWEGLYHAGAVGRVHIEWNPFTICFVCTLLGICCAYIVVKCTVRIGNMSLLSFKLCVVKDSGCHT